jgi:hypothetical protein
LLLAGVVAPVTLAEDCSCTAPDGSCSASTSCDQGCFAYCDSGDCDAGCFGGKNGPLHDYLQSHPESLESVRQLDAFNGPALQTILQEQASLALEAVPPSVLEDYVTSQLGSRFAFVPRANHDRVSFDFKNVAAEELVEILGRRGGAAIASHGRLMLAARGLDSAGISRLLSETLGMSVVFTADSSEDRVSISFKDAPIEDVLSFLTRHGVVQISEQE